jgi:ribonuclease T2
MIALLKRFCHPPAALAALVISLAATPGLAQDFDYYVLSLSWSPTWCAGEADRRDEEQCHPSRDLEFTLHGLWPQYEAGGWPEFCRTVERDPSRGQTREMADIMGSSGLAWYQWKKHGRCSGLSARDYFETSRFAFGLLNAPDLDGADGRISSAALVERFVSQNPGLKPQNMIVTCRGGQLREVRVCLDKNLSPRACSRDVRDDACRTRGPLDLPDPP